MFSGKCMIPKKKKRKKLKKKEVEKRNENHVMYNDLKKF